MRRKSPSFLLADTHPLGSPLMLGVHGAQLLAYFAHLAQQHRLAAVEPRITVVEPHDDRGQHPEVIAEAGDLAGEPLQGLAYEGEINRWFIRQN